MAHDGRAGCALGRIVIGRNQDRVGVHVGVTPSSETLADRLEAVGKVDDVETGGRRATCRRCLVSGRLKSSLASSICAALTKAKGSQGSRCLRRAGIE